MSEDINIIDQMDQINLRNEINPLMECIDRVLNSPSLEEYKKEGSYNFILDRKISDKITKELRELYVGDGWSNLKSFEVSDGQTMICLSFH